MPHFRKNQRSGGDIAILLRKLVYGLAARAQRCHKTAAHEAARASDENFIGHDEQARAHLFESSTACM